MKANSFLNCGDIVLVISLRSREYQEVIANPPSHERSSGKDVIKVLVLKYDQYRISTGDAVCFYS